MNTGATPNITKLLVAWGHGDQGALDALAPLVQQELHRVAARQMAGERRGHILQPTALVNEVYVRLVDWHNVKWQNRAHFFGVAARIMRRILVDAARARGRVKRGGDAIQVSLSDVLGVALPVTQDLVALDDALKTLETLDARQSQVVELRFFGGLSLEEVAEALQVSVGTVRRDWSLAQAWLYRELSGAPSVMTPERHRRVGDLYHAALAMAQEERTTFLESRCGGDADLLRDVQSLLTAHRQAGNFIAAPALATAGSAWSIGQRFAHYEVLAPLGEGGMGEVYRARDRQLGRDVAIKILPRLFATDPERRIRFEREARLLASLNHPHIGAIYGFEVMDGAPALVPSSSTATRSPNGSPGRRSPSVRPCTSRIRLPMRSKRRMRAASFTAI